MSEKYQIPPQHGSQAVNSEMLCAIANELADLNELLAWFSIRLDQIVKEQKVK